MAISTNLYVPSTKPQGNSVSGAKNSTVKQLLLSTAGILSMLDSLIMLELATKKDRTWLLAHPEHVLQGPTLAEYQRLVKKRVQGVPIAYLTGVKEFYGLELKVNKHVLIPRPETEAMVEEALKFDKPTAKLLDVGTGSGAIAIAIAKQRPSWQVTATDISKPTLEVANTNARQHGVKIKFLHSNLLLDSTLQKAGFDVICANLPYVKNEHELSPEAQAEPAVALLGGDDGLKHYRTFFNQVTKHLLAGGRVIIEADPWQHLSLIKMAQEVGLQAFNESRFMLSFSSRASSPK